MKKILGITLLLLILTLAWSPWITKQIAVTKVTYDFENRNSRCSDCGVITEVKTVEKVPFGYLIEYETVGGIVAAKDTDKVFVSFLGTIHNFQKTNQITINQENPTKIDTKSNLLKYCINPKGKIKSAVSISDCGDFKIVSECCDIPDIILDKNGDEIMKCGGFAGWSEECQKRFPKTACMVTQCNNAIPASQDGTVYPPEAYTCKEDSECAIFTCGCGTSLRKDYKGPPAPPLSVCTVVCNTTPKCISNKCTAVPTK